MMEDDQTTDALSDADLLLRFESSLRRQTERDDFRNARVALRTYLWRKANLSPTGSIPDAVEVLAKANHHSRDTASVLLRALSVQNLLPGGAPGSHSDRSIAQIVESALPKLCEFLGVDPKDQTFVKIRKLAAAHARVREILAPLTFKAGSLEGIVAARQPITAALNHSIVIAYCDVFRIGAIRGLVEKIIHDAQQVLAAKSSLLHDVDTLSRTIDEGLQSADENGSFLYYDFLVPFLEESKAGLDRFISSARSRFAARITLGTPEDQPLPKRYPLHETGRQILIRIPMRNTGPGIAIGVRATITAGVEPIVLGDRAIALGDIPPGDFSILFDVLVMLPIARFQGDVEIEWGQVGVANRETDIFGFSVLAQAANVDWSALEYWHPYGTDPAEGDRFVGRAEIVKSLASRLLRTPIEPFYITGQKRVGKTSLALATVHFATQQHTAVVVHSKNILWGQIAHAEPLATLAEFAQRIDDFIRDHVSTGGRDFG
jgi:hypothetical protein